MKKRLQLTMIVKAIKLASVQTQTGRRKEAWPNQSMQADPKLILSSRGKNSSIHKSSAISRLIILDTCL